MTTQLNTTAASNDSTVILDQVHDGLKRTIYAFVRTDLSVEQQMVQAAHAAAEAGRRFYRPEHGIASLIILAVSNLQALYKAKTLLESRDIEHDMFFEPDWNMGHSAIGTRPLLDSERRLMKGYQLWKLKAPRAEGVAA